MKQTLQEYGKSHYGPILLLLLGGFLYLGVNLYWSNVCATSGCSLELRRVYLGPLRELGLILVTVAIPFLFVGKQYFITWFRWLFLPLLIIGVYLQSQIDPYSSNILSRTPAYTVAVMLPYYVILTLAFITAQYVIVRNSPYKYVIVTIIAVLAILSVLITDPFLRNGLFGNIF